jgi:hypothetical protein
MSKKIVDDGFSLCDDYNNDKKERRDEHTPPPQRRRSRYFTPPQGTDSYGQVRALNWRVYWAITDRSLF